MRACSVHVVLAIADHDDARAIRQPPEKGQLLQGVGDDGGLVVPDALEVRPADEREVLREVEVLEDPRGGVRRLRCCHGERQAALIEDGKQVGDAVVHLVLEQADIVITLAVQGNRGVDVGGRHAEVIAEGRDEWWPEEGSHGSVIRLLDAHRVEGVADAVEDARCRVGEGPVEVEQENIRCRGAHGPNIAHPHAYCVRVEFAGGIEVVAHRGASEEEPEHSLAAYLLAVQQGADAIECDVRLTADGTLVCVHDRRIDRTSTGRGAVSGKTLEELTAYDYSRTDEVWRDYEDPPPDETRTSVLTLQTLLATMLEASSSVRFAIETKHPTRYGRYVEDSLVEMLRGFGLTRPYGDGAPRARVMSFSRTAVRRVSELVPLTPTVYLMDDVPRRYRDGSLPEGVQIAGPSVEVLREHPEYVGRVHERGGLVHVWTVDERADVELCVALGVDAVITNRPGRVLEMLGR